MLTPGAARSTDERAVVRERRELVAVVARRHADHVRQEVGARVGRQRVVVVAHAVGSAVARRRDEQHRRERGDRVVLGARGGGRAQAEVHDLRPALEGLPVREDHVGGLAGAGAVEHAQRQDLRRVVRDAGDTDAVATLGRDRSGHVRPVSVLVGGVVVAGHEVVAGQDVRREVGVGGVHARVDHRHDRAAGDPGVPCFGRVDVGVGRAGGAADRLARVLHRPELGEVRVVGTQEGAHGPVRLGVEHPVRALERALRRRGRLPGFDFHELHPLHGQLAFEVCTRPLARFQAVGRGRAGFEPDDQLVWLSGGGCAHGSGTQR